MDREESQHESPIMPHKRLRQSNEGNRGIPSSREKSTQAWASNEARESNEIRRSSQALYTNSSLSLKTQALCPEDGS
jgi:hypothetical protein